MRSETLERKSGEGIEILVSSLSTSGRVALTQFERTYPGLMKKPEPGENIATLWEERMPRDRWASRYVLAETTSLMEELLPEGQRIVGAMNFVKTVLVSRYKTEDLTDEEVVILFLAWRNHQIKKKKRREENLLTDEGYPDAHPNEFLELAQCLTAFEEEIILGHLEDWQTTKPELIKIPEEMRRDGLAESVLRRSRRETIIDRWRRMAGIEEHDHPAKRKMYMGGLGEKGIWDLEYRVLVTLAAFSEGHQRPSINLVTAITRKVISEARARWDVGNPDEYEITVAILSASEHLRQKIPDENDLCHPKIKIVGPGKRRAILEAVRRPVEDEETYHLVLELLLGHELPRATMQSELLRTRELVETVKDKTTKMEGIISEGNLNENREVAEDELRVFLGIEEGGRLFPWAVDELTRRIVVILEADGHFPEFEEAVAIEATLRVFSERNDFRYGPDFAEHEIAPAVRELYYELTEVQDTESRYRLAHLVLIEDQHVNLDSRYGGKVRAWIERAKEYLRMLEGREDRAELYRQLLAEIETLEVNRSGIETILFGAKEDYHLMQVLAIEAFIEKWRPRPS